MTSLVDHDDNVSDVLMCCCVRGWAWHAPVHSHRAIRTFFSKSLNLIARASTNHASTHRRFIEQNKRVDIRQLVQCPLPSDVRRANQTVEPSSCSAGHHALHASTHGMQESHESVAAVGFEWEI